MAMGKAGDKITGYFIEKDYGARFEFRAVEREWLKEQGCTHEIAVNDVHGYPYRGAKILKTVVHVLTDEDENGNVWQKWQIKKRVDFGS